MAEFDTPLSRAEALLQNALGAENEVTPMSRIEDLLQKVDEELEAMDVGTISNVNTVIADNKIQFFSKPIGGGD